jgi:hypothetical protein
MTAMPAALLSGASEIAYATCERRITPLTWRRRQPNRRHSDVDEIVMLHGPERGGLGVRARLS